MYEIEIREEAAGTVIEVAGEPTPEKLAALCKPFGSLAGLDHAKLLDEMLDALYSGVHLGRGLRGIAEMLCEGQDDGATVEWTPGRVSLVTPTSSSRISLVWAIPGPGVTLGIFLPAKGAAFDAASGALTLLAELIELGQNPNVDGLPDLWAWSVSDLASRLVEALRARSSVRREAICAALRRIYVTTEQREAARGEARRLIALANNDLGGCPGGPGECRAEAPLCGPCQQARRDEDELYDQAREVLARIGETLKEPEEETVAATHDHLDEQGVPRRAPCSRCGRDNERWLSRVGEPRFDCADAYGAPACAEGLPA